MSVSSSCLYAPETEKTAKKVRLGRRCGEPDGNRVDPDGFAPCLREFIERVAI
jgi:hypothetical protein